MTGKPVRAAEARHARRRWPSLRPMTTMPTPGVKSSSLPRLASAAQGCPLYLALPGSNKRRVNRSPGCAGPH